MGQIIAIANQKGGVGKTTTAINLATVLAMAEHRCLVVDADPQCNATTGLGHPPLQRHPWLKTSPLESVVQVTEDGPELLPGSPSRQDADALSSLAPAKFHVIVERLKALATTRDFVLIDCPPSLGRITQLALLAADSVIVPLQCEYFAMEGLAQMFALIDHIREKGRRRLELLGILLNQLDPSWQLAREVAEEVRGHFPEECFRSVIPREEVVSEATSHGRSVVNYSPRTRASLAYVMLGVEVLQRCHDAQAATVPAAEAA